MIWIKALIEMYGTGGAALAAVIMILGVMGLAFWTYVGIFIL